MIESDRTTETCEACSPGRFQREPFVIYAEVMINSHSEAINKRET